MTSKTISLPNEVYNLLSKLKLPIESFSDVIKRLCSEKLSSELLIWIKEKIFWSDMKKDEFNSFKNSIDEMSFTMDEVKLS